MARSAFATTTYEGETIDGTTVIVKYTYAGDAKRGDPYPAQVVRTTRHGPVLSDVEERAGGKVLAMRWTAQFPARKSSCCESQCSDRQQGG